MQMEQPTGRVAYEPNSLAETADELPREAAESGFTSFPAAESGEKSRVRAESFADHYSQARQFYVSQTPPEQAHLASALVFELSKVAHVHIREAMVGHLRHIDEDLAARVAAGLALDPLPEAPPLAVVPVDLDPSPALQLIGKMKDTLEGRQIAILVADGSDGAAVEALKAAATEAGATVKIVAPKVGGATLADGTLLEADGQLAGTPSVFFDAVAVVLSAEGAAVLTGESAAKDFVGDAFAHLKAIAADGGGEILLTAAGIEKDDGVVPATDVESFIAAAKARQWEREPKVRILA